MQIESILREIPLFASLGSDEINALALCMKPVRLKSGEVLFHEGEKGTSFYIILEGQLQVIKSFGTPDEHLLQTWGPGNFIGEMSMFDRAGLRAASIIASTPANLLEMSHINFDALLRRQPGLAYEVMRQLSLRLKDTDDAVIRDLQEKNRQLAQAYSELKAAQEQIIEKERLERELEVARDIQQSILPPSLPVVKNFELGACMVPARAVGGDLYDMIPLDDDRIAIVIGDVSDKGVPAAIFMALTSSLVHAEAHHATSPEEVLQNVNHLLMDLNNAGLFVTIIYGILDCQQRTFSFVRGGHEIPISFSSNGKENKILPEQGQALGLFERLQLDRQTLTITPGDTLLLFTDGATDALNPQGNSFGHAALRKTIKANRHLPAQELCTAILQEITNFQSVAQQTDDIALVAICGR